MFKGGEWAGARGGKFGRVKGSGRAGKGEVSGKEKGEGYRRTGGR